MNAGNKDRAGRMTGHALETALPSGMKIWVAIAWYAVWVFLSFLRLRFKA